LVSSSFDLIASCGQVVRGCISLEPISAKLAGACISKRREAKEEEEKKYPGDVWGLPIVKLASSMEKSHIRDESKKRTNERPLFVGDRSFFG